MASSLIYNFVLSLAGVIMITAGISDALRYRIPNIATAALLLLFPVFVVIAPMTVPWLQHSAVFAIVLALGYPLYLKGLVGAGDVKFIAACALWAGPHEIGHFLFITAMSGGILALGMAVIAALRRYRARQDKDLPSLSQVPIPYGIAIAIGGLCTLAFLSHPDLLQPKI